MAGFEIGIINIIADNLRDRYKSSFQVLKEIIQNTDDAASQSVRDVQLDFGFTHGLPDADHPLLQGPAIFFLNNGPFTELDARAVKSFGLNSKAAENAAIGKFGLGMKSVFHFCEAFFWLAQDEMLKKEEILNPWSGSYDYPKPQYIWDNFSGSDATKIKTHLQKILIDIRKECASSFLLWIPLRQRRQLNINGEVVGSIISEFPGDDLAKIDFLFETGLAKELAELLPLLHHLTRIRCWRIEQDRSLQLQYSIQLGKGAQRNTYPNTKKLSPLAGVVGYKHKENDAKHHLLKFSGYEGRASEIKLQQLRESSHWPKSYVRDAMGRERPEPDKAKGHCAVTFSRSSEKTNGRLNIQWAVFLPVEGGREKCFCKSEYTYTLTLHGFFFIDAGRSEIEGLGINDSDISFPPDSENDLRIGWNYYLSTRGTFVLLIHALEEFVKQLKLGSEEIKNLCEAIGNSSLFRTHRKHICRLSQWIFKIDRLGAEWARIKIDQKILPLPAPPQKQPSIPWEVFPHLSDLQKDYVFVQKYEPHLTFAPIPQWDEITLIKTLDFEAAQVFASQSLVNYLKLFLQDGSVSIFLVISTIQDQLKNKIRTGFLELGQQMSKVTASVQEIVSFIKPENRYILKTEAHNIIRNLQKDNFDCLLLHKNFDSENFPGTAKLSADEGLRILENLDNQLRDYEAEKEGSKAEQCREIILEILKNFDRETRHEVLRRGKTLKVITAYACQSGRNSSFTVEELENFRKQGTLFLYTQGVNLQERLGLSLKLQAVLSNDKVLLLTSELATIVFGITDHGISQCLAEGCLNSIGSSCKELSKVHSRAELIAAVAGVDLEHAGTNAIRGFRYLLHGDKNLFFEPTTLWVRRYQQNPVWSKLWGQLTGHEEGNVLVDRLLAEVIPQDHRWKILGLREIDQQGILDDIREKGTASIIPDHLDDGELVEVLLAAQYDRELWNSLPFHETLTGKFVPITESTYREPSFAFPLELNDYIQIIKNSPDPRLLRLQNDAGYIKSLSNAILIENILRFPEPQKYLLFILDSLSRMKEHVEFDLKDQLQNVKWLVDIDGNSLCPSDIICLPGLNDEVSRLISAEPGSFWQPESLSGKISNHPYFPQLKERLFSHNENGLEKLALLLENNSEYSIGPLSINNEELSIMLKVFGKASINQSLPGWRTLQAVKEQFGLEQCEQYILRAVLKTLSVEKICLLFRWLENQYSSADHTRKENIFICHLRYLEVFSSLQEAPELLGKIRLLNQYDEWRLASELCTDTEGISSSFLLNDLQRRSLITLLPRQERISPANNKSIAGHQNPRIPLRRDLEPEINATIDNISTYFQQWECVVQKEIICAFISMLGDDIRMRELAEYFQGRHSVQWIRDNVSWVTNKREDQDGRKGWLYGLTYQEALSQFRFIIDMVSGKEVVVTSLLGKEISVELSEHYSSFILDRPFYEFPKNEINYVRIRLRKVNLDEITPEQFSGYLKTTAEYLFKMVYAQERCELTSLWDELNKSEQLDVRIALRLVMKHIPFYLDQLGVHKHQLLKRVYNEWNEARYKAEEYSNIPAQSDKFQIEEEKSRQKLQKLLESDADVQQVVLDSVRRKMRDFQYTESSIPFELFQNADDAVVEQLEIEAYPDPVNLSDKLLTGVSSRFVVQQEDATLRFMHWGRPINSTGMGGFPGRDRGFYQDLEKMLVLSSSNKSSEHHLTGKFGLGFKSVLLVSDNPRFISGRLGVEIIAGFYPKPLSSPQALYKLLSQHAPANNKLGTLIELPLRNNVNENILDKFINLSGVLAIFSKTIRRIDLVGIDKKYEIIDWLPDVVLSNNDVDLEKGSLYLWKGNLKEQVDALYFRCKQGGGLLVGFSAHGFFPLSEELPPVWIVAPTREKGRLGFCINGQFEVDAGRARLAGESGKNTEEAHRIGNRIGKALCALFQRTIEDWSVLREQLRLVPELTIYEFWESVWSTLTKYWCDYSEKQLDSEVLDVVNHLLCSYAGLGLLIQEQKALPNGLWGKEFQRLIDPNEIQFVLRDSLSEEEVFRPLSKWQLFKDKIDPDTVISAKIFPSLGKILPGFTQKKDQWQSLRLAQVIHLLKEKIFCVDQNSAEILGGVITKDLFDNISKTETGQKENQEIRGELEILRFQAQNGEWHASSELLRSNSFGSWDDEPLRACFAPQKNLLNNSYDSAALDFFIICRGEMKANAENMAKWIFGAITDEQKSGGLNYLINGELGDQVASRLRYIGTENSWLSDLSLDSAFFVGWAEEDIKELLYRKLPPLSSLQRHLETDNPYDQDTAVIRPGNVAQTLENIFSWWHENQTEYLADYEARTYPNIAMLSSLPDDDRSAWLTVLMIGSFHTMGRANPEQHRSFLSLCEQKGWWDIFTKENPKEHPDEWMSVLEDYIDGQEKDSQFEYWMRLFPTIYKFARELKEYIEVFYSLQTQGKDISVLQTMAPKTFSGFQGGGFVAAPIASTLGMGVPFVLREMMRKSLFKNNRENICPYCYVPLGRVRNLFSKMGCSGLDGDDSYIMKSQMIHQFLCEHLGDKKADFFSAFDIPFQFVAEDLNLQEELFV